MTQAYVYDAVRTPRGRGRPNGSLHEFTPIELLSQTLAALSRRSVADSSLIEDVIIGCVSPHKEQGSNIGRVAALNAGYAQTVPGVQVNRFCASGLEAVNLASALVMSGQYDLVVGGGVESMSRVPMGSDLGAWAYDPLVAFNTYFAPQGVGADTIATKWGFSRTDVDSFAVESQKRAARAWAEDRFKRSIIPVVDNLGMVALDRDEHMRPDTTLEGLGALKTSFDGISAAGYGAVITQRYPEIERINHVHHGGNSSGIVDGAAAVLIGSEEGGKKLGLKPRARIRAFASIGSEPAIMLTGPAAVTELVLKKAKMSVSDIDIFELNEAFASVVLLYMHLLNIPHDKLNVNGGAIAMGHPLGATGAMILGTVVDELERSGKSTALVSLCVGAGMGTAAIIERV